jgi:hypothetical protein
MSFGDKEKRNKEVKAMEDECYKILFSEYNPSEVPTMHQLSYFFKIIRFPCTLYAL